MYGNPLSVLFPQRDHDLSRDCREVLVVGCSTNSSSNPIVITITPSFILFSPFIFCVGSAEVLITPHAKTNIKDRACPGKNGLQSRTGYPKNRRHKREIHIDVIL